MFQNIGSCGGNSGHLTRGNGSQFLSLPALPQLDRSLLSLFQMPRNRIRTTDKAKWTSEQIQQAMKAVNEGTSIRKASKQYGIPFSTLQERLKSGIVDAPTLGRKCDFPPNHEQELAEHVKMLSKVFYGMTTVQLRRTAYEYATRNNIKHRFNHDNKMAGLDWLYGFLKRHHISVRKPEAVSIGRATGFNKQEVSNFFENLEGVIDKHKFKDTNLWNVDETGISTVQDPGSVLAEKGQKRVGSVTSWERGKNITVVCALSTGGQYVPPMFIFPRQRMSPLLGKNGPPGSIYHCSKSGWITEELFMIWLQHFSDFTHASTVNKMLLILDNHTTHCTLEAYDFCKERGIVMLSLPPHTSHRLQPLDVTFYSPLKAAYRRECDLFLKSKNLVKIVPYDVAEIFYKAYSTAATISKATKGFEITGIHPFNPEIFTDEDFLVETMFEKSTDLPITIDDSVNTSSRLNNAPLVTDPNTDQITSPSPQSQLEFEQNTPVVSSCIAVPIEVVSPLPGCSTWPDKVTSKASRPKQHSEVLTSTPMKEKLEIKQQRKEKRNKKQGAKSKKPNKRKIVETNNKTEKRRQAKKLTSKKLFDSDSDDFNEGELLYQDESENDDLGEKEEVCFYCEEFGIDGELWFRCTFCGIWVHQACSGWDSADGYKCDSCDRKQRN